MPPRMPLNHNASEDAVHPLCVYILDVHDVSFSKYIQSNKSQYQSIKERILYKIVQILNFLENVITSRLLFIQTHGSVVTGIRPVTERSLVQTPLWSLEVVCCALRQSTLSIFSQFTQLKLGTGLCWELTCDGQVSWPSNGSQRLSPAQHY